MTKSDTVASCLRVAATTTNKYGASWEGGLYRPELVIRKDTPDSSGSKAHCTHSFSINNCSAWATDCGRVYQITSCSVAFRVRLNVKILARYVPEQSFNIAGDIVI